MPHPSYASGLVLKSRLRGSRVPGSKPGCTERIAILPEDPSCMG
ncbi:hypothetical protein AVEN_120744-1, partial [Araneus ventricosus]